MTPLKPEIPAFLPLGVRLPLLPVLGAALDAALDSADSMADEAAEEAWVLGEKAAGLDTALPESEADGTTTRGTLASEGAAVVGAPAL